MRGVSFVHGNMLGRRGVKCTGMMHVTDWFPTLVNLAGTYNYLLFCIVFVVVVVVVVVIVVKFDEIAESD